MNDNPRDVSKEDFLSAEPMDRIKTLLKFATLAPSTHNSQPWTFEIGDDFCVIRPDTKLRLPAADPLGRDLYISIGCAVENLVIAAKFFNTLKSVQYQRLGNGWGVRIYFKNLGKLSRSSDNARLISAITNRTNSRGIFEPKKIDQPLIDQLLKDAKVEYPEVELVVITDPTKIIKLARLTAQGIEKIYANKAFRHEFSQWINPNFSSRREGIPGYALKMPTIVSMVLPTLVKHFNLGKRLSRFNYASIVSAPAIAVISTLKNTSRSWIDTGRLAERAMLELTSQNIKSSVFVAAIETKELNQLAKKIIHTGLKPQFIFCLGYMQDQLKNPTPRHSLKQKILLVHNRR